LVVAAPGFRPAPFRRPPRGMFENFDWNQKPGADFSGRAQITNLPDLG
jgi:hypothetical protein